MRSNSRKSSTILTSRPETQYEQLTLRLRKRMFSSLHAVRNFDKLNKEALNFLFCQIKGDYLEFEILRRPRLTIEDAGYMAALALQVKRYKKILTSKDNTMKREEI